MIQKLFKTKDKNGNPNSVLRIFLIIVLAIVVDQSMIGILLEELVPIDPIGTLSNQFLILSIPCAVFFASLSDFHCRRKLIIFALSSLTLASIFNLFFNTFDNIWFIHLALLCKGIGGNVTPIALASLATIIPSKKFTTALAIAICGYSLGSWVPIYLRAFIHLSSFMPFFCLICFLIAVKWFKETKFDDFKLKNNTLNLKHFLKFACKDWKEVLLFLFINASFSSIIVFYL